MNETQNVPLAEFAPDLPALSTGSSTVTNVIPISPTSYGPVSSLSVYSSPLDNRCQGAVSYSSSADAVSYFAGDVSNLYQLTPANTFWNKVSKSIGAYNTPADQFWRFALMNGQVIATNYTNPMQVFLINTGNIFADLSASAPNAKDIAVVKNFLVAANTTDPTFGTQQQRVWWSAVNDPTNWPTLGTATAAQFQSDSNDFFGDAGDVQRVIGNLGTADGAVFQEHAVWRMIYAGPPTVFNFFPAEGVQGTPAPGSVVQRGALVYYLGEDGFYMFDGTTSVPIGANKVDKFFFRSVDQGNLFRICAAVDPINKLILWAAPISGNAGGNPNSLWVYAWQLNKWTVIEDPSINIEYIFRALSFGYTLDTLDNTGFNLDTLPFSLDSRVWTGGNPVLAAFDGNHKTNFFTGASLAATIDTSEANLFQGKRSRVRNVRPFVEGTSVTPSVAVKTRDRLFDSQVTNTASAANNIGWCPQNVTGRYVAGEITIPAGSTWTQVSGMEVDAVATGPR